MAAYYPLLVPLIPLVAALFILLCRGLFGEKVFKISVLIKIVALGVSILVLREVATPGKEAIHLTVISSPWTGLLRFDFTIDRLAAVMMVVITGISILISHYCTIYMQSEPRRARFYFLMDITTFVLLCVVSSANLLMLFIFWQLLSWFLCLLAHNYPHKPTVKGSFKTFTMLRFGDIAFLGGIILAYSTYGTLDFRQLFSTAAESSATFSLWHGGIEFSMVTVITLLIFIGAMSKSAQFPLHVWLPESLYAPTPIHAFLHGGIINAGGFLLNRLAPLYVLSPATLHVIFTVGLLTVILGASTMITQNDIKKKLGFSTIAQMGYMIMECGLGAFGLAVFHLIAHGLFKATVFLNCGNVINDARKYPKSPYKKDTSEWMDFSLRTWITGFIVTLILPLFILLVAHGSLKIPFRDLQGILIFLFFAWVTSSQAILSVYRLHASSWKLMLIMPLILIFVLFTYLLAGEKFTYFLYPSEGLVHQFYMAAALPSSFFDSVIIAIVLFIVMGWVVIYAKTHGRTISIPKWINGIQVRLYLFFMNRFYIDALSFSFNQRFKPFLHRLDKSNVFKYALTLIALALVVFAVLLVKNVSFADIMLFSVIALMLPLFPFHGAYVVALKRLPGYLPILIALLLPIIGLYILTSVSHRIPAIVYEGVGVLALFGALYGSFKALIQYKVTHVLAYMSVALYSILWWYMAKSGTYTPQGGIYASAVSLVTCGLFLAWHCVQVRYGDLNLERIGGLARPMPRFAIILALLVMAAMGLPPFGLFSGYIEMLLHSSFELSWTLVIVLFTLFAAAWYMFRLMQRLLFGPYRRDILYKDLRYTEVAYLLVVLLLLATIGITPYIFSKKETLTATQDLKLPQFQIEKDVDKDIEPPLFPINQ